MKRIKEYKIIKAQTSEILEQSINKLLKENNEWEVFGYPFFDPVRTICQAIVKYENKKQIL